ncbi:hypothetical protein [Sagittula stellata]|uniref:5-bromo-4-chloroindolyl phosphate hydrolysis protein n=1 Tax=Sagittula stellata (strain ATCC 700073 / DSM 11524 / E-37) TaxID=388399 RepID=A3K8I6_SAGS3|nr:hypothetical protein [Sagittula stellata]EBA06424.1 hypothetical protein SSE37_14514 [Sagittula stellata E-37]
MPRILAMQRPAEAPLEAPNYDSGLNILFLAAFPLFAWMFEGTFSAMATAMVELWVLTVALRMIAHGTRLHAIYRVTPGARAPRIPRKILGSLLIGMMITVLAGHRFHDLVVPLMIGICGFGLSIAAFGPDPMRDKTDTRADESRQIADIALEHIDHRLATIADRIAMLEDAEITRRTEAARTQVLRLMRSFARDPQSLARLTRPVDKFISLLDAESNRLCDARSGEGVQFARRRYIAKLDVMMESFETSARKTRVRGDKDAFEVEADLLLDRMPANTAA